MVLHEVNRAIHARVWDVLNGELQSHRHETYRVLYVIFSSKPAALSDPDTSSDISLKFDALVELDASVESDALVESGTSAEQHTATSEFPTVGLRGSQVAHPTTLSEIAKEGRRNIVRVVRVAESRLTCSKEAPSKEAPSRVLSCLAIYLKKLDPASGQLGRYYNLDDTREWVTCPTKRICWIPPGYIGSGNGSHCWAGNVLVMVGHDGVLRMLTFREPLEGQEMGVEADFS